MTDEITYTGLEIAHLIGGLVLAPIPAAPRDREMRRVLLERAFTKIRHALAPDIVASVERQLEALA